MTKRGRTDGHLSKEEYARLENDNFAESGEPSNSSDFVVSIVLRIPYLFVQ